MSCPHLHFTTLTNVTKLTDQTPAAYMGHVRMECADCGVPFRFVGISQGADLNSPRTSFDGSELRTPIEPIEAN